MKAFLIMLNGDIVVMTSHDHVATPCIFFDKKSALIAKENYFNASEYEMKEVEATFKSL